VERIRKDSPAAAGSLCFGRSVGRRACGGADKAADEDGRTILIVVGALNDFTVDGDARLILEIAFTTGSENRGRCKMVGISVRKTGHPIAGGIRALQLDLRHCANPFIGGVTCALIDGIADDRRIRIGFPGKEEFGRRQGQQFRGA